MKITAIIVITIYFTFLFFYPIYIAYGSDEIRWLLVWVMSLIFGVLGSDTIATILGVKSPSKKK